METKCSICTGPPERLAEVNALLAQQEPYKSIAMITGCSKSSIGRHAGEEQTQETIAVLQAGALGHEEKSLRSWESILKKATERGDSVSATRAQLQLDKLRARIAERKEQAKPRRGPSNVPAYKADWRLCRECLWLQQLGYYTVPSHSTEGGRRKLAGELMPWATTESEQTNPEWDVVTTAMYTAVRLMPKEWPVEYQATVEKLRAVFATIQPAIMAIAKEVRRVEDQLQKAVQDV